MTSFLGEEFAERLSRVPVHVGGVGRRSLRPRPAVGQVRARFVRVPPPLLLPHRGPRRRARPRRARPPRREPLRADPDRRRAHRRRAVHGRRAAAVHPRDGREVDADAPVRLAPLLARRAGRRRAGERARACSRATRRSSSSPRGRAASPRRSTSATSSPSSASASCASRSRRTRRSSPSPSSAARSSTSRVANLERARQAAPRARRSRSSRSSLLPGGQLPLPTKYRIYFGEPMHFDGRPRRRRRRHRGEGLARARDGPVDGQPRPEGAKAHLLVRTMENGEPQLRDSEPRSSPAAKPRSEVAGDGAVLITGICGRLGKGVARVLHRERRVVGVDRRPFPDKPKDIEHRQVDIRRKKLKDVFRSGDIAGRRPPRRHARPARVGGRAPLVERRRLREAPRVRRAVPGPEARRPLERERLRPAAGQPAVPHRGRAAPRRRRTSARSAISSRSTCSRRASSGSTPRPRRSSCARCTSSGRVRNAPSNYLRLDPVPTAPRLRPDGAGHPPGRRRPRDRARARARRPRHLQPRGPRAVAALAHHQDPRAPAHLPVPYSLGEGHCCAACGRCG